MAQREVFDNLSIVLRIRLLQATDAPVRYTTTTVYRTDTYIRRQRYTEVGMIEFVVSVRKHPSVQRWQECKTATKRRGGPEAAEKERKRVAIE